MPGVRIFFVEGSVGAAICILDLQAEGGPAKRVRSSGADDKWKFQVVEWKREIKGGAKMFTQFDDMKLEIKGLRMTERVRAILNMVVAAKTSPFLTAKAMSKQTKLNCIARTIVDISQNPVRRCFTPAHGCNHTLCTSSVLVHLGMKRMVLPCEHFAFQGHGLSRVRFGDLSNSKLRTLAGEGMCLPCLGVVLFSLHLLGYFSHAGVQEGDSV